ncbi:MAG TPA: DUF6125 family protein [Spirochaetota bacterium]|nr:DUF6125 family protein [Spirochaetota bacterium]
MGTLSNEQILELAQKSFVRMDGAWFLAVAKKYGIQAAWEMDVEAWKQLSYVMGKMLKKTLIPDLVWPGSLLDAMEVFMRVLDMKGRSVTVEDGAIVVRVTDCEIQKAIAKAGIADCGIATVETYKGVARGLFGKDTDIDVEHTKNLNRGADCCEVRIRVPAR